MTVIDHRREDHARQCCDALDVMFIETGCFSAREPGPRNERSLAVSGKTSLRLWWKNWGSWAVDFPPPGPYPCVPLIPEFSMTFRRDQAAHTIYWSGYLRGRPSPKVSFPSRNLAVMRSASRFLPFSVQLDVRDSLTGVYRVSPEIVIDDRFSVRFSGFDLKREVIYTGDYAMIPRIGAVMAGYTTRAIDKHMPWMHPEILSDCGLRCGDIAAKFAAAVQLGESNPIKHAHDSLGIKTAYHTERFMVAAPRTVGVTDLTELKPKVKAKTRIVRVKP